MTQLKPKRSSTSAKFGQVKETGKGRRILCVSLCRYWVHSASFWQNRAREIEGLRWKKGPAFKASRDRSSSVKPISSGRKGYLLTHNDDEADNLKRQYCKTVRLRGLRYRTKGEITIVSWHVLLFWQIYPVCLHLFRNKPHEKRRFYPSLYKTSKTLS